MVTVIVPVYKIKEEYLRNCISSLLDQGRTDYKVILVDDGSPDNCGAICDEYSDDSRITVIHQENQGVSVARNNAIKATDTKWLTFVDADDWVEPDYIKSLYEALHGKANDADVVMFEYSREFRENNSYEKLCEHEGYLDKTLIDSIRKSTFYKLIMNGNFNPYTVIAIWDKVYRTDFLKLNNLYFIPEARKGQDRLFNADVLNYTEKIYYLHRLLYKYRCWEDSRTNRYDPNIPKLTGIEIKALKDVINKHALQETTSEYLKCRICTRLYACMRLYYFHDNNKKALSEKIRDVNSLVNSEPYKSALKDVNIKLLNCQERVFIFLLKLKAFRIVYRLVKIKSRYTQNKLN